jgi:hypothetical protein
MRKLYLATKGKNNIITEDEIVDINMNLICIRKHGSFKDKAFCLLGANCNWEIIEDEEGCLCLIRLKK